MSNLALFIKMLPEIWSMIKWVKALLQEGYTLTQIKKKFAKINEAFDEKNPNRRSAMLNSAFKKL